MRKLFGTDGIRGKTNTYPMTAEVALKLGMAAATVFKKKKDKIKVIIGKDTRLSGYIFEYALTSGLCSLGADVYLLGPMPTPAVAHLTKSFSADTGIMITASHNPTQDNGIKFFDREGFKLPDEVEEEIEELALKNSFPLEKIKPADTGKAYRMFEVFGRYISYAKESVGNLSLDGFRIVLDCANGAAYKVAPMVFFELGADVVVIGNNPDGTNINKDCGSLYPKRLSEEVLANRANIGIALDGDADRLITVDENGEEVDGDQVMAIAGIYLKEKSKLSQDTVVATVMSNIGLEKALNKKGIKLIRTKVGDRYVIEEMRKGGYNFGGEQSGHMIFLDHCTTGDGIISGLQLLRIMKDTGRKLSELKICMKKYPQAQVNIKVKEKPPLETIPKVMDTITDAEEELGDDGRVVVRYSGTEKKCRVMVEGKDEKDTIAQAEMISEAIKKEIGEK